MKASALTFGDARLSASSVADPRLPAADSTSFEWGNLHRKLGLKSAGTRARPLTIAPADVAKGRIDGGTKPVDEFRLAMSQRPYFEARQEWEGYVSSIGADTFTAILTDITNGDGRPTDEAIFSLEDVTDNDKPLFREGAVFRWTLGYRVDRGTRFRASIVTFRRLPAWSKRELEQARTAAKDLAKKLRPE